MYTIYIFLNVTIALKVFQNNLQQIIDNKIEIENLLYKEGKIFIFYYISYELLEIILKNLKCNSHISKNVYMFLLESMFCRLQNNWAELDIPECLIITIKHIF